MTNGPFSDRPVPGQRDDRSARQVPVRGELQRQHHERICDRHCDRGAGRAPSGRPRPASEPAPTCIAIEPALGKYLYTSNNLDGTVSGEKLDPHNGGLTSGPEHSVPFLRPADLRGCRGEWSVRSSQPDHQPLDTDCRFQQRAPRLRGFLLPSIRRVAEEQALSLSGL